MWAPWNLICEDQMTAGDGAEIHNPAPVHLSSHAILSQNSYLCGAAHNFDDPAFPLLAYAMEVGAYAWVSARACVGPGVKVGEGAGQNWHCQPRHSITWARILMRSVPQHAPS